jgi:uncharacterized RDD family membrane protein YckC
MHTRSKNLFVSAIIALSLAFTFAVVARAQEAAPQPAASTTPEAKAEPVTPALEATPVAAVDDEAELRRLDEAPAASAEVMAATDADGNSEMTADEDEAADESATLDDKEYEITDDVRLKISHRSRRGPAEEMPFGNHTVPVGSTVRELVSIFGSSVVEGESERGVVSILGNSTVNGKSGGEVVSVLGNTTINGEAEGEVVAVLGNVNLGPKAIVHGDVVAVGGVLNRDPGAVIHGNVQEVNILGTHDIAWLSAWIHKCLLWGRPLAFGENLGWAWTIAIAVFIAYVFLALLFPRAFEKCAETLEQRPGYSMLAVLLTTLITPVLLVLLIVTGVGILLVPFVIAALLFGSIFGKAVMHAWLGRRITKHFGAGPMNNIAVSTLVGGGLILLLYTVPFLGFFLWKVLGVLGLGVVVYTLVLTMRSEKAESRRASVPPVAAYAPSNPPPVMDVNGMPVAAAVPQPLPVTTLPRAGFWLRMAASALDAVLIGILAKITHTGAIILLLYAVYCVALWALKGTTIGGIICGLKVVRLDERKLDWTVAIVRGLGGFLSLFVAGLGFLWVAFDKERQSWHDKIAGTVVVIVPKGTSLV